MTETSTLQQPSRLPDTSSQVVRQRWLDLFDWSYSILRVTGQEIEPGVHAMVIPAACKTGMGKDLLEAEVRVTSGHVPSMARGLRLELSRLNELGLAQPDEYRGWMGEWGKDVAAGQTEVMVFVDLAYLEAAMLERLWDHGVIVDFGSPLAFFRRGSLTEYLNIYEAVTTMVAEGCSLADTARRLASEILSRLQLYANVFLKLSCLYTQATWHIDHDNYVVEVPGLRCPVNLQYWQLREGPTSAQKVLKDWRARIEQLLQEAAIKVNSDFPKSFAA